MAKFDLKAFARAGAQARVSELTAELESIFKVFPDLRTGRRKSPGAAQSGAPAKRRRRRMTAAQKKAVSLRMKKYWASRRDTAKKG